MCKAPVEEAQFIIMDPKQVEYMEYSGTKHLATTSPLTTITSMTTMLKMLTGIMDKRYQILSEYRYKSIGEYNIENPKDKKGRVIIVIDEFSDLVLQAPKEAETSLIRIAQMGRAAGLHLVLATQRPTAKVITGLIKANVLSRIALAVPTVLESRIILDRPGAEQLRGNGDMLFLSAGEREPIRLQGVYITNKELLEIIKEV